MTGRTPAPPRSLAEHRSSPNRGDITSSSIVRRRLVAARVSLTDQPGEHLTYIFNLLFDVENGRALSGAEVGVEE